MAPKEWERRVVGFLDGLGLPRGSGPAAPAGAARRAFCDIDSFGRYNKALGQAQGDETLRAIAATILARVREGDEVYRRGGEELVVLLPSTDLVTAASVAERIRRAVEDLGIRRGPDPGAGIVTVSIGVASFDPIAPVDPGDVEVAADRAVVAAKEDGKNRVRTTGP